MRPLDPEPVRSGGRSRIDLLVPAGILLVSFLATLALMPSLLKRLRERCLLVEDKYKTGHPAIVTHAGLLGLGVGVVALTVTLVISPYPYLTWSPGPQMTAPIVAAQFGLFTICGYGIVGAIDDRHPLSHLTKAAVPFTLSLPSVALALSRPESTALLAIIPGLLPQATVVLLVVVPLYILVVSNLVNMHSGFNGLQSGLSLILLGTLIVRLAYEGRLDRNLDLVLVFGTTAAFLPFNRYPAKAIEGNVGSFLVGAAIGVGISTNGLFLAGVVMLAPHILDFLLFTYTKVSGRPFVKFGRVRPDGTIEAPYPYKLKFLLPFYLRLTERQTVRLLYLVTSVACLASLFIPL